MLALIAAVGFVGLQLCAGCSSIVDRPEELRAVRREIVQCNDDLNNSVQILTYCARITTDSSLANRCLDGVLEIVGQPIPEERVYATSLSIDDCESVVANAASVLSYREKLYRKEQSAEIWLNRDFHKLAREATTFRGLKLFSALSVGAILLIFVWRRLI